MLFWKSSGIFLGLLLAGAMSMLTGIKAVHASAPLASTFTATAPTSALGTIRQVRVDSADGSVYVLGSSTSTLGLLSADGSTYLSVNYSTALPSQTASDLAVSQGRAFIVINGTTNAIYRYDISAGTATFIASSSLASGTSAITFGSGGNTLYASKALTIYSFDTNLSSIASNASASSSITRMAYGGGKLFYISAAGRFASIVLGVSDTTIATGGPSSATVKGLVASNDGSALYYANTSGFSKLSVASGTILWTRSISTLAGIDVATSTGRITVINSSGVVTTYNPINSPSDISSSASGTDAILTWTTSVSDADFSGVTIRRSMSSYPTSATDGEAVTSSDTGTSFTDTGLAEGTYYYSLFNQTSDGYYSAAATSSVTIDLPPDAPALSAEATDSTINLSWSVPIDTTSFELRRDTTSFPVTHTDGYAVTTTNSTVTSLSQTGMPDGAYYYSIFAADAGGHYSAAGTASVTIDTTPPSTPTLSATASSSNVFLSWDTPLTTVSFLLRRSLTDFPTTILEGVGVTSTVDTSFVNVGLDDGTYYYSIFARDSFNNYSNAGTASTTIDTTAPSAPSSFSALASGSAIHLSWSNPIASDFASSTIRRSTTSFPTSKTDGAAVTSTTGTSYDDTSLADGTYYYSIFAEDTTGNVSVSATASAIVDTYVPPSAPTSSGGGGVGSSSISPSALSPVLFIFSVSNRSSTNAATTASSPAIMPPLSVHSIVANPAPMFTRVLRQGDRGADVKALQVFLNAHGFVVAKTGQGSRGHETSFFGAATVNALKKFQEVNKEMILKPLNLEKGTGIFGVRMMGFVNGLR